MKKLSSLLLALAGSLACSGANGVPSHIVQPLPRELDPRLEQPLTPPSHIVRPLTEEETARRERELAPVPTAGLKEDGEKAIQTYSAQEKTVDGGFRNSASSTRLPEIPLPRLRKRLPLPQHPARRKASCRPIPQKTCTP